MTTKVEPTKNTKNQLGLAAGEVSHEEIAERARAIYEQSGRVPGRDLQNWLMAETQLREARKSARS